MSDEKKHPQTEKEDIEAEWARILAVWEEAGRNPISEKELEELQRRFGSLSMELLLWRFDI